MGNLTMKGIEDGLFALGVKKGMMLEVHCSLSRFGLVEGGAHTVIRALQRAVGREGAIVMPSFRLSPPLPLEDGDRALGLTSKIKILPNDEGKTGMGVVADTFRCLPGVVTGDGLFRVSAWGREAAQHAAAGFQKVIDEGGCALLLGVDIYRLSAMHYVEDCLPPAIRDRFRPSEAARKLYPENEWLIESWAPAAKPWYTIQSRAYEKGYIVDGRIGQSRCMLCRVGPVVELYREALLSEPLKLYGLA